MTDAAVVADSSPAPDAAPLAGAPINEHAPVPNSPLGSQIPPDARAENQPKAEPRSINDSIDRAFARSEAKEAEKAAAQEGKPAPKAEVKPEPKPTPDRGEGGKFVAKTPAADARAADQTPTPAAKPAEPVKPSHTAEDAPARFTETAKAKWHTADPEIRGEVLRMHKELTDGFQKYKTAAERDGTLNEFHEMAAKQGTDVKTALTRYVNIDNLLRQDFVKGIEEICNNKGVSHRDLAAHVLNQSPDKQASQQDATIRELRQELAGLKQQLGGVTQTIEQQREQATLTEVKKFADEHPRFNELANDIAFFMQSGRAKDLPEAYELAERLNPAPAKAPDPAASSAAPPEPPVQPDKGQKSINGAPSAGLTSRRKTGPAPSIDEALNRAFGQTG